MYFTRINSCDTSHYGKIIPQGWCCTTLGDIADFVNGRAFKPEEWEPSGRPIIRIQNLNDGSLPYNYSTKDIEHKYLVKKGDLLFAWAASLGAFIWEGQDAWLNQHIFKVTPSLAILKEYLYFLLQAIISSIYAKTHGSGMVHITKDVFLSELVYLPPFNEQTRIVNRIDGLFKAISALERVEESLTIQISSAKTKILTLAIQGKLGPQDPSDEPAIELIKRINPAFTPSHNLHYEGTLPLGWALCRLEDILEYEQPQSYIVKSTDYSDAYATPVLTPGKSFILGYTNETEGIYNSLPVIIFDDFTTESKYVDFPFKVKSSAMKMLRIKGEIDIRYVAFFMSITRLSSDTHKRYWISEYSKLCIPIPPLKEQTRIVQTIKGLLGLINGIRDLLNNSE